MHVIVCAVAAVSLSVLAGCGTNKGADGNSSLTAASAGVPVNTISGSPGSPSGGTPSAGSITPSASPSAANSPAPITYPNTAQGYTTDALNAYANRDSARLGAYVNNGGAVEFANIERVSGPWHFHACSKDGDNTDCAYDNSVGDRLTVSVVTDGLHQPHGVTGVVLDKTTYESDASNMVNEFIGAWENGNVYRMSALSTGNTASKVNNLPMPSSTMITIDITAKPNHTIVTVAAVGSATIVFDVDNSKLGHAHAITLVSIAP